MTEDIMRDKYRADRDAKYDCAGDCSICVNGFNGEPCRNCLQDDINCSCDKPEKEFHTCRVENNTMFLGVDTSGKGVICVQDDAGLHTLGGIGPPVDLKGRPVEDERPAHVEPCWCDGCDIKDGLHTRNHFMPSAKTTTVAEQESPENYVGIQEPFTYEDIIPETVSMQQLAADLLERLSLEELATVRSALKLLEETPAPDLPVEPVDTFPWASGRYLRYDLIPMDVLTEIVEVLTFGQWKHVDQGQGEGQSWTAGVPYSQRINKIHRHLMAFVQGEDIDYESGRHALAHVIVQAMMLLGMVIRGYENNDDRPRLNGSRR